jgi:C-terminal processing protease CtpA/Prc
MHCTGMALVALLLVGALAPTARAAEVRGYDAPPVRPELSLAESLRLQRLTELGRVWGAVRYLHPDLATRDIDWDRALVEAIPRVDKARSPEEFRAAIDRMLATLQDPATRTLPAAAPRPMDIPKSALEPPFARRDGEVLRIDLGRMAQAGDAAGSWFRSLDLLDPLEALMPGAKVWVLDARATRDPEADVSTALLIGELHRRFANTALPLGAWRYRRYDGYPTQTGSPSSGGYTSGLVTEAPRLAPGAGDRPLPPLVIVTNENTALPAEWIVGLQARGAWLVSEGDSSLLDAAPMPVRTREGLVFEVRTAQLVAADGGGGVHADMQATPATIDAAIAHAIAQAQASRPRPSRGPRATAVARFDQDRAYPEMRFPSREYRLLAFFRFWNVIEHFFPYKSLIGTSWNNVPYRYIPQFEADRDAAEYQLTLRKLAAELKDSHAGVRTPMPESALRLGSHHPPVIVDWLEGKTVVVHLLRDDTGLRIGDVVLSIDGTPAATRRGETGAYVSASTEQAWQRDLHRNLLRGARDSTAELEVQGLDGARRVLRLRRDVAGDDPRFRDWAWRARPLPVFGLLPDGLAYVDLARLQPAQVDAMFAAIAPARAAIFDMRGYPNATARAIAPRLTTKFKPVAAQFRRKSFVARDGDTDIADADLVFVQRLPAPEHKPWPGKVVMLINEQAQSQAEHTGLYFEAATELTYIGSPTAGANGDVTEMVMPGNLAVSFSGQDVRHGDGRQLQRLGLQPDVVARPTIAGMARGEDEVLAAARNWLKQRGYTRQ